MVHYALVGRGVLVGDGGQEPMMSQRRPIKNAVVWLGLLAAVALFGLAACSSRPATALSIAESPSMNLGDEMNNLAASLLPQTENYTDPAGPLFTGEAVLEPQPAPDEIVVVSYNLRYGEAITETIQAFQETLPLPEVDIVMLQEMDEAGVATIAEALGFNYVYYPASVAEDGDNFGNAILARWPISEPAKLILPGLHPLTGQQRTATRAVVHLGGTDVGTALWALLWALTWALLWARLCWSIRPTSKWRRHPSRCAKGNSRPSPTTSPTTPPTSSSAVTSTPSPAGASRRWWPNSAPTISTTPRTAWGRRSRASACVPRPPTISSPAASGRSTPVCWATSPPAITSRCGHDWEHS